MMPTLHGWHALAWPLSLALVSSLVGAAIYASLCSLPQSSNLSATYWRYPGAPSTHAHPQAVRHIPPGAACSVLNATYRSSALEQRWMQGMAEWQADYCGQQLRFEQEIARLNGTLAKANRAASTCSACSLQAEDPSGAELSQLVARVHCAGDGAAAEESTEPIEPLMGILRGLFALSCLGDELPSGQVQRRELKKLDYMLPAHASFAAVRHAPQKLYFDLGASTWTKTSQSVLLGMYHQRGIEFDRILLWEATPLNATKVFEQVPARYVHAYQLFNTRVTADPDGAHNPLRVLLKVARPEDFVVLKLDIDNRKIESALYKAIMADPQLQSRIDEFYWEQHFNLTALVKCCWGSGADKSVSLADAYENLMAMRRLGIRAHGWP